MCFGIGAPLLRSLSFMSTLPQVNYKIESLENLMSAPPLEQTEAPFSGKDHSVSFEDVRFDYQTGAGPEEKQTPQGGDLKKDTEVLHGISFSAGEGSLTALVGESGSGKSTLAKLLVHFYDVTGGEILIDGQDIRHVTLSSLRNAVGVVQQDVYLFSGTVAENIAYGKPGCHAGGDHCRRQAGRC